MKRILALILALLMTLSLVACGGTNDDGGEEGSTSTEPVSLSIATGTSGGTFYVYGGGVASVVSTAIPNVEVTVEATQGASANIELLRNNSADIIICEAGMVYDAMNGTGDFEGMEKFEGVRAIAACYANKWTALTLDQSLTDTTELDGKNIGVSTYLSGADLGSRKIYGLLGMDNVTYTNTAYADGFTELYEGRLDACSMLTGHPSSPVLELETKADINFLRLTPEQIDLILENVPYYSRDVIPAGTYKAMTEDYDTVSSWVVLFVREDMDEDLVYQITKAIMENNETMVATHATAKSTIPENIVNQPMILHKGAVKYYEEVGVTIPDNLKG